MSSNSAPIKVLVVEDVLAEAQTIKNVFESNAGMQLPDGKQYRFECEVVRTLDEICKEATLEKNRYDLIILDLNLSKKLLIGANVASPAWNAMPSVKICVFSGVPVSGGQEGVDFMLKMAKLPIWDYFIKGRPSELLDRIIKKWSKEIADERRKSEAEIKSRPVCLEHEKEWLEHYVAFYIDGNQNLRPDPGKFGDKFLVDKSYLGLLLQLAELRGRGVDISEKPFITFFPATV